MDTNRLILLERPGDHFTPGLNLLDIVAKALRSGVQTRMVASRCFVGFGFGIRLAFFDNPTGRSAASRKIIEEI